MIFDQTEEHPFDWLITMRRAGRVTRVHTREYVGGEYRVDGHSWGVALLVLVITRGEASSQLLAAALLHDTPELVTGDVPSPAKHRSPLLETALRDIENSFKQAYGLNLSLTEHERQVLKLADYLELCLWCNDQMRLGNNDVLDIKARVVESLHTHPLRRHTPSIENLIDISIDP